MLATCALIHYDFRVKNPTKDTRFPVHLQVTFRRFPKTYSLRISLTRSEFKRLLNAKSVRPESQLAYHFLNKASDIIRDLKEEFSWVEFENRFFTKSENNGHVDLLVALEEYAEAAMKDGRIKTFQGFRTTLSHVRVFHKKKRLPMSQLTPNWLKAFDDSLRSKGMRTSSIGIHVRNIRTVFNWEIS
jgi:integrase/recombinase XerD